MVLNLFIKEVRGITKSSLYLVELAASAPKLKRDEGSQAAKAVSTQQLDVLLKVLQCLTKVNSDIPPYGESHLTRVLKDLLAPKNYIALIGHITQEESEYVETMHTLYYMQQSRPKNSHKGEGENMTAAARDRLLRKINQENNDLKTKLERIKRIHSKHLEELRQLLGVNLDLERLVARRVTLQEMDYINEHKKAVEEGDRLEKRNHELEAELERSNERLKELHREYDELQEKKSCEYIILQEDIWRFKEEIKDYKRKIENREQYYESMKQKQTATVEQNATQIINDKLPIVGSVRSILKAKETMAKNTETLRSTQKDRERKMYSSMERTNLRNYNQEKDYLVDKYTKLIEDQKKEYSKYVTLYQNFRHKKKYCPHYS
eukprot:TRINITY_DN12102_c0_g4_i2.p1 TRINITY_DN12102_c0_g4~~TRINITY_DN12102_c0_g4_i2.p1  ORF type:complete len:378 (+),score=111.79 TRINITY_DN12102_c0_g4_i2:561-1694(+)